MHRQSAENGFGGDGVVPPHSSSARHRGPHLPRYNHNGDRVTKGIKPEGESGRRGVHPWKFLKISFRSTSRLSLFTNVLWPFVPAAIVLHYVRPKYHLWIFILSYIGMVPSANLLGFAGQEFARKMPKVLGIIVETSLGSLVELILFMVLIARGESNIPVIKAAILGSILANLLLCLGLCFFAGGLLRDEQTFHEAVSEVGSGLMLVAAMGLVTPAAFYHSVTNGDAAQYDRETINISRATAVILLVAYVVYVWFQAHSHHGLYEDILEADEKKDADRHKDLRKAKLTMTEAILGTVIALTFVSLMAVFLVDQIHHIVVERGVSDLFMGLILVPLVEKLAEHLTAIDEAWDNQMNFALSHVLGSSIQTALLNTPLVVLVGWGLGHRMELNFEIFDAIVLVLAILVVGSFLRDGKSNYLEGVLCVFVYIIIAICAFYYPNPPSSEGGGEGGHH
ncbi:Ca2+/H+ antiporter [Patellaria atrata CBS 101060]|uniref:Vacuolar calcium ion transporter n=1 Tax=Patellaria atrata CBS 101060 TaxID=1346257 RepID=A0A9P4VN37_9PEZI|nr:Ca2+/H+ antiporter [Patellaria atrata CBS 101060]